MESDPDGAREARLRGLGDDPPAARTLPCHAAGLGRAEPHLLAMILFEKCGHHQPLNRQSERFALGQNQPELPSSRTTKFESVAVPLAVMGRNAQSNGPLIAADKRLAIGCKSRPISCNRESGRRADGPCIDKAARILP